MKHSPYLPVRSVALIGLLFATASCGDDSVANEEDARAAYIGLDDMIGKALTLGMEGFNAASSANIPEQMGTGEVMGTIVVGGQVDMGASDNKGLRLTIDLTGYQDTPPEPDEALVIVYDSAETSAALDFTLRNIPDGELQAGSLVGTFLMSGDLEGAVTLNLTFTGMIQDDGTGGVARAPGTIQVTGTATSDYGTFNVNLTL
jgi:hypothetical protein